MNSLVELILAEGDEERVKQFYTAIAHGFKRQFNNNINNPVKNIQNLLTQDHFSKNDFNRLMDRLSDIYQQRFKEQYFAEGNKLLTQIQQLLSDKD